MKAAHAFQPQERAGQGVEDPRQRPGGHEQRDGLRPVPLPEPSGQVVEDAREKARLRRAEEEAKDIETLHARDEHHGHGDDPPEHHDARDPHAGPDARQDHVARDFEEEVADEEDPRPEAEDVRFEIQVVGHAKLRHTHIDPIDVGDRIEQEQVRKEAPGDLVEDPALEKIGFHQPSTLAKETPGWTTNFTGRISAPRRPVPKEAR